MRITNEMGYRSLLRDLERISERMQEAQNQITSGKKLSRPSDDPAAASDVVRINAEKGEISQYLKSVATGKARLDFGDTVLDSVERMTERIRDLGLLSQNGLAPIAAYTTEIQGLRDQIFAAANSTFEGQFIFGGSRSDSSPYVLQSNGLITYAGNSDAVKLQIGRSSTLQTQLPGDEVFSGAVNIFTTIDDLLTAIKTGDKAGTIAQTTNLEQCYQTLGISRARLGSLVNVAQTVESELGRFDLARTEHLMRLEDADLPTALTEFTKNQTALQAATAVGARISNISILDYLR